jgi:hypothetical protein
MKVTPYSIAFLLLLNFTICKSQTGLELANKMIDRVKALKSIQCTIESKERILENYHFEKGVFKINISPFKAYMKQEIPNNGLEVLMIAGDNGNNAKVNPNAFPWVNLNLDPQADLMMKDHHHSIYHAGFNYVVEVLDILLRKYQSKADQIIVSKGISTYQGQEVYVLECNNPYYKTYSLSLTKPESPFNIGLRLHINYFSILELNPGLKAFSVIAAGKTIQIPTDYASKMLIYLHRTQLYPVYIKVMDPKGLFEEYKFTNLSLNPVFKTDTFSADNPAYHF